MRNEGRAAAGRQNVLNKYDHHSSLTVSLTCEVIAVLEVHGLHALGEHDLVDSTCGRERQKRGERIKMRNEEARAAGLQNVLNKYDHHSS